MTELLVTVVTSAAVGAVVSSLVTSWSAALERKSRRKELFLSKAITLAELHTAQSVDNFKTTHERVHLAPYIVQVRWFQKELNNLYSRDALSPDLEESFKEYIETGKLPAPKE